MIKLKHRVLSLIVAFAMIASLGANISMSSYVYAEGGVSSDASAETSDVSSDASDNADKVEVSSDAAVSVSSDASSEASTDASSDASSNAVSKSKVKNTLNNMRGVWVAFPDFYSMGLYNKSKSTFTKNVRKMYKTFKKNKINTVFFHVCPCNDATFKSSTLKWSTYMFPKGKKPSYDPMKILVKEAHSYGLAFHAWINPYRKTIYTSYNPGKTSSINRVVRIVKEIINNYDVDGIHMDDYFYPSGKYKKLSVKKKKSNVNKMVKKVYKTVKAKDPNLIFGISPAGNITYAHSIGCDLETWMNKSGYIDYILPQIYWSDSYKLGGKTYKMYSDRLKKWTKLNKSKKVKMIIGLGLYRAGTYDYNDKGWLKKNNNIVTQIKKEKKAGCTGFVFFSARFMTSSNTKKEMNNYRKYMGIS